MMSHARFPHALLRSLFSIAALAAAGAHAFEEPSPQVRAPLAVTTGHAVLASEQLPGASARSHAPCDLLTRVPPDSLIAALIDSTSVARVTATIERLEAYGTRYVSTDSCRAAGGWIRDRFTEYGYADVRTDTFRTWTWQDSVDAWNVLAYKPGALKPSEYVVLGGHYDSVTYESFSDPSAPAPGAEDNATGVASVLEAARLLADVETVRSVVFACWSAEEEGLWGSRAFVADAVADSMDVVLYLNMDAIGYLAPPQPDGFMMADSSAIAVAAWMCDVARQHTGYIFEPVVQPLGASDHNSFWEAGYNVVDSQVEPTSPLMHTPDDVIENLSVEFATAVAGVNIAAAAAVAGVVEQNPNLPPETTLVANCAADSDVIGASPTFEWESVDFDGAVEEHRYSLTLSGMPPDWISSTTPERSVSFSGLPPGAYEFRVHAIDDEGLPDPSPAWHAFTVTDTFAPLITVDTNFLPGPLTFRASPAAGEHAGGRARVAEGRSEDARAERRSEDAPAGRNRSGAVSVYENELLRFEVRSDASSYCGRADSVSVAVGESAGWGAWAPSPLEFVLRPGPADTVVYVRTRDGDGAETVGALALRPVEAPMNEALLHVDDWLGGASEPDHDAFYVELLEGHEHTEWDPLEHIDGGVPSLPSMEELGRYGTVFWTVGPGFELLRNAQAESAYHSLEGFVRAGGNLILEGRSPVTALVGVDPIAYDPEAPLPGFVTEHVGIDTAWNSGNLTNVSYPETYGWAFLGAKAIPSSPFDDAPVDTLGKWADNFGLYGGVPWCEAVSPNIDTRRIYLFDSFLNPTLSDVPCATLQYAEDGTGMVGYFGFPFYYIADEPARDMVDVLLAEIDAWREPAELVFLDADARPSRVTLTWYLTPADGPQGCHVERKSSMDGGPGDYARLNDDLLLPNEAGRFSFTDATVAPWSSYLYRLVVVEQCGSETRRGPWSVETPGFPSVDALLPPVPNPASRSVAIPYVVGSDHRRVVVGIYDCAGRLVRTLRSGPSEAGEHTEVWDGTNVDGREVASGVYFVRAELGDRSFHRKVVLLR